MQRERDYWAPQIRPLNSPFQRPLTPNGLLGSFQKMNGPSISNCPEAAANLPVPFRTFAVALLLPNNFPAGQITTARGTL